MTIKQNSIESLWIRKYILYLPYTSQDDKSRWENFCKVKVYKNSLGFSIYISITTISSFWHWTSDFFVISLLTALIPDSCCERCSMMATRIAWRYMGERKSSGMVTFFSLIICWLSSLISCMSALTSSVPRNFIKTGRQLLNLHLHLCQLP